MAGPFGGALLGVFVFGLLHITRVPVGTEERLEAAAGDEPPPSFSPYGALGSEQPFGGKAWGYGTAGEDNSSYL